MTAIIRGELVAIRDQFGDKRRSEIVAQGVDLSIEDLIAPEDMVVTLSHGGYMKAQPVDEYRAQKRGGRGKQATATKEDDFVDRMFIANTHDYILCFSNRGRVYWLKVYNVPQGIAHRRAASRSSTSCRSSRTRRSRRSCRSRSSPTTSSCSWPPRWAPSRRRRCRTSRGRAPAGIIAVDLDDGDSLIGVALTDGTARRDAVQLRRQGGALRGERRAADGPQRARRARHDARPGRSA